MRTNINFRLVSGALMFVVSASMYAGAVVQDGGETFDFTSGTEVTNNTIAQSTRVFITTVSDTSSIGSGMSFHRETGANVTFANLDPATRDLFESYMDHDQSTGPFQTLHECLDETDTRNIDGLFGSATTYPGYAIDYRVGPGYNTSTPEGVLASGAAIIGPGASVDGIEEIWFLSTGTHNCGIYNTKSSYTVTIDYTFSTNDTFTIPMPVDSESYSAGVIDSSSGDFTCNFSDDWCVYFLEDIAGDCTCGELDNCNLFEVGVFTDTSRPIDNIDIAYNSYDGLSCSTTSGDDTCDTFNNEICEDGRFGSVSSSCTYNTDKTDCDDQDGFADAAGLEGPIAVSIRMTDALYESTYTPYGTYSSGPDNMQAPGNALWYAMYWEEDLNGEFERPRIIEFGCGNNSHTTSGAWTSGSVNLANEAAGWSASTVWPVSNATGEFCRGEYVSYKAEFIDSANASTKEELESVTLFYDLDLDGDGFGADIGAAPGDDPANGPFTGRLDCDDSTDNGSDPRITWFQDCDGDGDATATTCLNDRACEAGYAGVWTDPAGYTIEAAELCTNTCTDDTNLVWRLSEGTDCDDQNSSVTSSSPECLPDNDGDGIPDVTDPDDDNDGVLDVDEPGGPAENPDAFNPDRDGDGIIDGRDPNPDTASNSAVCEDNNGPLEIVSFTQQIAAAADVTCAATQKITLEFPVWVEAGGILRLIAPENAFDPGLETIFVEDGGILIINSEDPTELISNPLP